MSKLPPITLVLGGARSGKSAHAEKLIEAHVAETGAKGASYKGAQYIATAEVFDDEMRARVEAHKNRRGPLWTTTEAPIHLAPALVRASNSDQPVLVDCLTVWLGNLMHHEHDVEEESFRLIDALGGLESPVIFVASEVGLGLVPETPLGRQFRDAQGWLNQLIAAEADQVFFVAAGLPLALKSR
ncbi:MAG: bifunctional adenosylcobinamide kinase/adenosylcobinamide-phosphate guanylyltransferase [Magnetovibrionaceae bacterium]